MTYEGDEIGARPSFSLVEVYIAEKGLYVTPREVFDYWDKKEWKTAKGVPVKTLEAAVNVVNSISLQRKTREVRKNTPEEMKLDKNARRKARNKRKEEFRQQVKDARKKARKLSYENNQPKPYVGYNEQLKDPRWKAFRWFIRKVRGEKCEICGSTQTLQVHHTHYNSNCMAWEYTCKDVLILCRECHMKIHKKPKQ